MDKTVSEKIMTEAAKYKRLSRNIGDAEISEFTQLYVKHEDDQSVKSIRVYSYKGFVARSYKYRCEIAYLQAVRNSDGKLEVSCGKTDAKRQYGYGALVTINGKGGI